MKSRKRGRSINQVEEHLSISLSLYLFTNGQIHARTQPLLWSRALHLREAPMGPVADKLVFHHAFEQRASITKDRDQEPLLQSASAAPQCPKCPAFAVPQPSALYPPLPNTHPSTLNQKPKCVTPHPTRPSCVSNPIH